MIVVDQKANKGLSQIASSRLSLIYQAFNKQPPLQWRLFGLKIGYSWL